MRVLIVGGSGFLGSELVRQAIAAGHDVVTTYSSRPTVPPPKAESHHLDVRSRAQVDALIRTVAPTAIINTAYRPSDWATTADGPIHLALAARATGAHLLQVSTDAVFSGRDVNYDETALPDPVTPYGAAKAAAETAIRFIHPTAAIVRTSLILGPGSPHEARVHAFAEGTNPGVLFTDDIRCPVHVTDLAAACLELATTNAHPGVHHVAGPDPISRYDLGVLIAQRDGLDPASLRSGLRAGNVPGPLDVRLRCAATQQILRTQLRGARTFLTQPLT